MLVILDRDGVINEDSAEYIKSPDEWHPIPGSLEAIAQLNKKAYQVVIASNQSGVARGYFSLATLELIHEKMRTALKAVGGHLDGIYFCPHHPDDNCECRKPKPGLLKTILKDFSTTADKAILIGDGLRDIEAAQAIQCPSILVLTGNGQKTLENHRAKLQSTKIAKDLASAVNLL